MAERSPAGREAAGCCWWRRGSRDTADTPWWPSPSQPWPRWWCRAPSPGETPARTAEGEGTPRWDQIVDDNEESATQNRGVHCRYLEAADGGVMCVALQHDLDILDRLLPYRSGTGHFIGYILSGFLQLQMRPNCYRGTEPADSFRFRWRLVSDSPAAGSRWAACRGSPTDPRQSWRGPPSPPPPSTPPGCSVSWAHL